LKNTTNRAQRSFVVEYKSNRRQAKAAVKSIWGNTDLKALSQAAADDMADLKVTADRTGDVQPNGPQDVAARDEDRHLPVTAAATTKNEVANTAPDAHEAVDNTIEASNVADPTPKQERKRQTRSRPIVRSRKPSTPKLEAQAQPLGSVETLSGGDILSILEMENKRLKQLLIEKLRSENILMKEMLRRTGE